ncbi:MAG: hypothetical protein D3916_12915, partial [Candidatus Electrothrix sp. MAN1_4]|nr:hypothetical protein [Candidatus Electrothrix sp. MAN1_4]
MVDDINFPGDKGTPLLAPEEGGSVKITTVNDSGWGNSIIWKDSSGSEEFHLAHLDSFGDLSKKGSIYVGAIFSNLSSGFKIGTLGSSGTKSAHLHISSRVDEANEFVELSGVELKPLVNNKKPICQNGITYVSKGPISGGDDDPDGNLSLDKVQGSKEGKDDWENSFELSMDDIYDMDFRAKLVQEDGAWPSDTKAYFYLSLDKELDRGDVFLGSEERDLTGENGKKKSIYLEDVDMSDYISSAGTYYVLTGVEFDGGEDESSPSESKQRVKLIVSDVPVPD